MYNTVFIEKITNCLESLVLENTSDGWVNENTFIGGRLFNDSTYTTTYGADIIKISLLGTSSHTVNNNYFIHQCVEGNEGSSNGLKIKLDHAVTNKFEMLRYEGTNPKVYAADSNDNILSNGYNLNAVTFTNNPVNIEMMGVTNTIRNAGRINGYYLDIQPSSNSYPVIVGRNTNGNITSKIMNDGWEVINGTNGYNAYKFNINGLNGYDNTHNLYLALRSDGGQTIATNADGTNHCFVISAGSSYTNGCFLWVYDGHLYGKMGSKPSTTTDGTVIL